MADEWERMKKPRRIIIFILCHDAGEIGGKQEQKLSPGQQDCAALFAYAEFGAFMKSNEYKCLEQCSLATAYA